MRYTRHAKNGMRRWEVGPADVERILAAPLEVGTDKEKVMRADYDSEANALSIDLIEVDRWDEGEEIEDTYCYVAFSEGRLANVELLNPNDHLDLLGVVAERFNLDPVALRIAAQAALAAPDRSVTLDLGARAAA